MSESTKKVEPWQLALILVLTVVFLVGLYMLNQTIMAKIERHEAVVESKLEMIDRGIERLEEKQGTQKIVSATATPTASTAAE
ncbi:MAG: hypothetical protein GY847_22145 [Proteobacteria bacterium]|nr:hypothetical protein [Pseudomonadota bacterium]